jgi:ribose transport system permease protein
MTILLISGGIDLSVGSVTALAMVIAGLLFLNGVNPWLAALIAVAACAWIGAVIGFFVTSVGLHHFIVTLAAMVIARGLCLLGSGGRPLGLFTLPDSFKWIGIGAIGVVPVAIVIFLVVVVVFDFLLRRTKAFRLVYYTGSNEKAAAYSGIRTCGRVVAVAAGADKMGPVRSVLRGGDVSTLVTDEDTAGRILGLQGDAG